MDIPAVNSEKNFHFCSTCMAASTKRVQDGSHVRVRRREKRAWSQLGGQLHNVHKRIQSKQSGAQPKATHKPFSEQFMYDCVRAK